MFKRAPVSVVDNAPGLFPAALLGLLGLPLIVQAGPHPELPGWAYPAGLLATIALGTITAMRTDRIERIAAIVATVLLASLCIVQISGQQHRSGVARPGVVSEDTSHPVESQKPMITSEKEDRQPPEEKP